MMRRFAISLLVSIACFNACFASDWKNLHEVADNKPLPQALEAVKNNPDSLNDLYVLGLVYLDLRDDRNSAAAFSKILNKDPNNIEARWGLAEVLRRQHKDNEAEELLNEVIKADPKFFPAYVTLAYIKHIRMDFEGSLRLTLKVVGAGRDKVDEANYIRAYALYAGNKGLIAHYGGPISKVINGTIVLPTLKKLERIRADSPAVLFGLGTFYLLAPGLAGGDIELAEEYLKKAADADPKLADIYARLAELYRAKGDQAKFEQYINKALELDPLGELALDIKADGCKYACPGK